MPAALVVVAGIASLFVVPLVATPALFIASLAWRAGPIWARTALAVAAALFVLYFLVSSPWGSAS